MKCCESYKRIHAVHCSLFPPKYYKYGWDRINVTTQKKSSLEQSSSLHNQISNIINPKYLKKERGKNLKFTQELLKDETRHSPANQTEAEGVG